MIMGTREGKQKGNNQKKRMENEYTIAWRDK